MSLSAKNQLMTLTKDLLRAWDETRTVWKDDKAEAFERTYINELESSVNRAIQGMEKLDAILKKVRRDCG